MAPDAFVAAGIADSPMMKTALTACRLALVIFVLPYIFVYNNALLLVGNPAEIVLVCITAFFGVLALAYAAQNYLGGKLRLHMRVLMFIGGGFLIYPGWITDLAGLAIVVTLINIRIPRLLQRFTGGFFKQTPGDAIAKGK